MNLFDLCYFFLLQFIRLDVKAKTDNLLLLLLDVGLKMLRLFLARTKAAESERESAERALNEGRIKFQSIESYLKTTVSDLQK